MLRGDPGMGASTLLGDIGAASIADGATVLVASGRGPESSIPMAAVSELVHGLPAAARAVSGPAGLLAALTELAASGPVVITVDDVDLADPESVDALMFVAHRLGRLPAAIVLARHHEPCRLDDHEVPELVLAALGPADMAVVLSGRWACSEAVVDRLTELTGGNPAAALAIAESLSDAERRGDQPMPDLPSPGRAMVRAYSLRMRDLPDSARRALCVAAAEPTGELAVIGAALRRLGDDPSALDAAEEAEVVVVSDGRVVFDHPLRRVTAYHLLAPPSRRAAHRALALSLDGATDAARRVRHLAASAAGPDEDIAADLELLARHLAGRGQVRAAAVAWHHAARLSSDPAARSRREVAAGVQPAPSLGLAALTEAERRVARAVGSGLSNRDAAATLFLSVKTVDAHLQAIYRKLGLRSRAELAVLVARAEPEDDR